MDKLNEYLLVEIFNRLDLQSRIEASKTCQLWRELLLDPKATKGVDVSEIRIESSLSKSSASDSGASSQSDQDRTGYRFTDNLDSILNHIGRCDRMEIAPKAVDHISATCRESIGNYLERLGGSTTVRMEWEGTREEARVTTNVDKLPIDMIERLILRNPSSFPSSTFNDGSMKQLKHLDMDFDFGSTAALFDLNLPRAIRDVVRDALVANFSKTGAKLFLTYIENMDALEQFRVSEIKFSGSRFDQLIKIVREKLFHLNRMHFHDVCFQLDTDSDSDAEEIEQTKRRKLAQTHSMTMDRLEFDSCTDGWIDASRKLLELLRTLTVSIELKPESKLDDVQKIYDLIPTIEESRTDLELTLNSIDRPRDLNELLIPSELRHVLVKLELDSLHQSNYLKTMLDEPYERLIEIHVRDCIELDDADLRAVARWCPNLRTLTFEPHASLGRDVITRRCFSPFLEFWSQRKSRQLSITCTDSAFGKLDPSIDLSGDSGVSDSSMLEDQEKGALADGKKWMRIRKVTTSPSAGSDQTEKYRLVIWEVDSDGDAIKSMVVKDYAMEFRPKVRIEIADGGFYWKE